MEGYLDDSWSDRLCGLAIRPSSQEGGRVVTVLVGSLVDQAALVGVLSTLYNLHLPLLSVECLGNIATEELYRDEEINNVNTGGTGFQGRDRR